MIGVKIELTPEAKHIIRNLEGAKHLARANLHKAMSRGLRLIVEAARRRVSGPRPTRLDRVTSRLYHSLGQYMMGWTGNELHGAVGSGIGHKSPVPYWAVHEFGYFGIQQISGHTRMQTHIFGVPVTPFLVHVAPYVRTMDIPARPYLQPAIDAVSPTIVRKLERAVIDAAYGRQTR